MAAGWAHLLELPNKIDLPRDEYLVVQQVYRGWALLGVVVIGALGSTLLLAWMERRHRARFRHALVSFGCVASGLAIFFAFTYPANRVTENWTVLPDGWEALRRQWEYSHAAGAILSMVALASLAISAIWHGNGSPGDHGG